MKLIYTVIFFFLFFGNCFSDQITCKISCTDKFGDPVTTDEVICNSEVFKRNECTINRNLGCLTVEVKLEKLNGICTEFLYKTCGFNESHASQYKEKFNEIRNTDDGKEILTKTRCFTDNCNA